MRRKRPHHPLVQILDVGDGVHAAAGPQHERVLGVQRRRHDPRLVLARLEVRVWEAEEDGTELAAVEEVGEELHGVGAEAGDVLVGAGDGGGGVTGAADGLLGFIVVVFVVGRCVGGGVLLLAEGFDFFLHEFGDGDADFESWSDLAVRTVGQHEKMKAKEVYLLASPSETEAGLPNIKVSGILGARAKSRPP